MTVAKIDHVNIRTPDLEGTVAFFRDVLGMEPSPGPGTRPDQSCWMRDAGGQPSVHIGKTDLTYPTDHWLPAEEAPGKGPMHHVALNCSGFESVKGRLETLGLRHSESRLDEIGLRQLFVFEPNGILFELNFWETPAVS
jgi:catechol 2,3-dioxygenase-like lactoylglutathione lyase family enzyme